MKTELDTPYVYFQIKEHILIATYKKGLRIDVEMAKEIVDQRLALIGDTAYPTMVFNLGVISINKAARDYLSSGRGILGVKAGALILDSPLSLVLGNFFLSVSRPRIPTRIFRDPASAMKWLQKFVN